MCKYQYGRLSVLALDLSCCKLSTTVVSLLVLSTVVNGVWRSKSVVHNCRPLCWRRQSRRGDGSASFHTERLKACKLSTLHFRRIKEDMIESYKILSGKYDRSATPTFPVAGHAMTRDHNLRLFRARYDLRTYYFTDRVVNIWNYYYY